MSSTQTDDQQLWDFIVHWRLVFIVVIAVSLLVRMITTAWLRHRGAEYRSDLSLKGALLWILGIGTLVLLLYSYRNH